MARTSKLPRYNEFNQFENCFGDRSNNDTAWHDYLDQARPLTLELGCGKAEVSLELARRNPGRNYIGIDKKSDRMWRPAKTALEEGVSNIGFIQSDIRRINQLFEEHSVDEIWITFPDPFPRERQAKHRLTHPFFLKQYKQILKEGGTMRFKTDDLALFQYSLERFVDEGMRIEALTFDLHESDIRAETARIATTYEKKWLLQGKQINYVSLEVSV